jgi:hypothetical protein
MLHLEPGKLSGRGAAHGLDSPAQLPRRASPAHRHHPRAGTCGVLTRAAPAGCPLPCCSPIWASAPVTIVSLERAGWRPAAPGSGKHSPRRPGVYSGRRPALSQPPALAGLSPGQNLAATARCHWPAHPSPLIPARDPSQVAAAPQHPACRCGRASPVGPRWLAGSKPAMGAPPAPQARRLDKAGTGAAADFWDGHDESGTPWRFTLTAIVTLTIVRCPYGATCTCAVPPIWPRAKSWMTLSDART